jgi:hypothetical protein
MGHRHHRSSRKQQFSQIETKDRALYKKDAIHPTQAGYKVWWIPFFEEELFKMLETYN